jgi:hypothetical protein
MVLSNKVYYWKGDFKRLPVKSGGNHPLCSHGVGLVPLLLIYLSSLVGPILVMVLPSQVLGWSNAIQSSRLYILGTLGQSLMDLPALIMFFRIRYYAKGGDSLSVHARSAGIGLVGAAVFAGLRIAMFGELMGGQFMGGVPAFSQSLSLDSPWHVLSVGAALLAYGPGEAIFVVAFIRAFDAALDCEERVMSWGLGITAFLWALPHVINVFYIGWRALSNVVIMVFMGLLMGLLWKGTRSSWGPIVFWTLVNGTSI